MTGATIAGMIGRVTTRSQVTLAASRAPLAR